MRGTTMVAGMASWLALAGGAQAQTVLDRADPTAHGPVPPIPVRPAEASPGTPAPIPVEVEPAVPTPLGDASVMVGAVALTGLRALTPADFADLVGDYVGRFATPEDLATLAGRIAARVRRRGYPFATASIAPQRLGTGVLTVSVDEGAIDAIRFDGPDRPAVRAALSPLISGAPVTLAQLERRLLIAGDIDGVRIRSSRYVREGARGVLIVRLAMTPIAGRVALTNDGTRPLGPEQIYLRADARGLLADDDALTLTYAGSALQPGEFQSGRVRYAKRVTRDGTEVAVSGGVSHSHPGAYLAPLDIDGRSWSAGLSLLQPLERRRVGSVWLTAGFDLRDSRQDRAGVRARHDRTAVVRVGLNGYRQVIGGRLRAGATLTRGLSIFDATERGDPLASRRDAGADFTSLDVSADWTRRLGQGFSLRAAVEAQLADAPLLVSEEVGLGGTTYLRGYDWSERSGDQGVMGALELRYDIDHPFRAIRRAQLYTFIDGGRVTNLRGGFGTGTLFSAGGGVRADVTRDLGANLEIAVPLSGPRYETGNTDPRVNLGVAKTF